MTVHNVAMKYNFAYVFALWAPKPFNHMAKFDSGRICIVVCKCRYVTECYDCC